MDSDDDSQREEMFTNFRSGFTIIIRGVFESEVCGDKAENYNSAFYKQFTQLHKKMLMQFPGDEHEIFIDEIRLRLNFMIEATDLMDQRMAVFSFLTASAIRFHMTGRSNLLKFLIDYLIKLYEAEDASVRANVCHICGQFLKYYIKASERDTNGHFNTEVANESSRDVIYHLLIARITDKVPEVRTAVYRAVALFQEVTTLCTTENAQLRSLLKTPKEMLQMGLNDKDNSCRLAAVQGIDIHPNDELTLELLAAMAVGDRAKTVRREAIKKLAIVPPKKIQPSVLQDILVGCLTDMDKSIVDFTKDALLSVWLVLLSQSIIKTKNQLSREVAEAKADGKNGLPSAMIVLLTNLNWEKHNDDVTKIAFACIDVIRRLISKDEKMNLADAIKVMTSDPIKPTLITWQRQRRLIDHRKSGSLATEIFVWRCMVQYCFEHTRKRVDSNNRDVEAIRFECFKRIVLPLKDTCETIKDIWQWKGNIAKDLRDNGDHLKPVDEENHNISLVEAMKVCLFLERDTAGMAAWKSLLEYMLKDKTLDKNVTDHITFSLATIHYSDPVDALKAVMETMVDLVHDEMEPVPSTSKADPNAMEVDLIAIEKPSAQSKFREEERRINELIYRLRHNDLVESDEVTLYGIQVVNGLMKTGTFKKMNPILKKVSEGLVHSCLASEKPQARRYAVEVTAIMCMNDESTAKKLFHLMLTAYESDFAENHYMCLNIFCDLIITYGYDKVNEWAGFDFHFLVIFRHPLIETGSNFDLSFKAAECAAKLFLMAQRDPAEDHWVELATSMMLRLFHKSTPQQPKLQSLLIQFGYLFGLGSRSNQMILAQVINHFLTGSGLANADFEFNDRVDMHEGIKSMIFWCKEDCLTTEAKEISVETRVHYTILVKMLEYLNDLPKAVDNPDLYTRDSVLYTTAYLDFLDIPNIPDEKVPFVQQKLVDAYKMFQKGGLMTKNDEKLCERNLIKIQKKLSIVFNLPTDEEMETEEDGQPHVERIPIRPRGKGKGQPSAKKPRLQSPDQLPPESPCSSSSSTTPTRKKSGKALFRD